jgi:orotate phosphoribosyltransferase-like protein
MAHALRAPHFEQDAYLYTPEGEYLWTESRMAYAYRACLRDTKAKMGVAESIVVSNVFPTKRSMKNYVKLAEEYGYGVTYIVVENRRGGQNIHNVPDEVLVNMRNAFQVEL